jgi:hypothetical protein
MADIRRTSVIFNLEKPPLRSGNPGDGDAVESARMRAIGGKFGFGWVGLAYGILLTVIAVILWKILG